MRERGQKVSEKVIRRLMKEEQVAVYYAKKKRRYSSYEGEVSPVPKDLIKRDFHAEYPNQKWLTDVSEFAGPDGKVYFSPILDCYDGYIVAYRRQRNAEKTLTQGMLEDAITAVSRRTTRSLTSWSNFLGTFQIFPSTQTEQNPGHFTITPLPRVLARSAAAHTGAPCEPSTQHKNTRHACHESGSRSFQES
ncbi:DDE-type integrase/transposase/recombinase [Arcanobacterium canis]|uniref:DDE-type integrase/transposase/recombinase n=1 Tax=Arcanobacterium canis TaxID=999183 RepID=UPI003BF49B0D